MGAAMERLAFCVAKLYLWKPGFLLPCDHRVRFPDSAAFVAGSLQTLVGDFRPEHFQSPGCRLVRVRFSVIRYPRHRDQAPVAQNSMVLRREDVIFHAIERRALPVDRPLRKPSHPSIAPSRSGSMV